ncbi:hypothetical protein JW752_04475 [Candidatus Peregrinibacteria bacterium]|nr:hypothetical protein [Candidatus Peregrinibacteria bacterium]
MLKCPQSVPSESPEVRVSKLRAIFVLILAFGGGALEQGCAHVEKKEDYKTFVSTVDQARLAREQGKFLEALQLYARADIKKLTEADQRNIEELQDGLEEQISTLLKKGYDLTSAEQDAQNNYQEGIVSLKAALLRMDKEYPDYEKTEKKIHELEVKIAALEKEYFELSYNQIADLYLADDYLKLAEALQRMYDITLALNRDPGLFKKENFLEVCWQIGEQYFKRKKFKEALMIFKLSEKFLLPGQAMPEEYTDMVSAAGYWYKKDWKERKVKIDALEKEALSTSRKRLMEIRAELAELRKDDITKEQQEKLPDYVAAVAQEIENPYPEEPKKPKPRRFWRRRKVVRADSEPVEESIPEPPKPVVDIGQKLERINTLLDEGKDKEAMNELTEIHKKYSHELVTQKRKVSFTLKRLSERAEKAYVDQQPKKAIRYYRAILLLDPSNARAQKQVDILEGLVQEANGL